MEKNFELLLGIESVSKFKSTICAVAEELCGTEDVRLKKGTRDNMNFEGIADLKGDL